MTEDVKLVKSPPSRRFDRETRLLDAVARRVAHYGYDKTSIDEIAQEAGVSKGAVYLHWPSKEALFDAVLIRESRRMLDDLQARIEADPEGGRLGAIYRHGMLSMTASPLILALYTRDTRTLGDYVRRQDPARLAQRQLFGTRFVRRMRAAGLVRDDVDPDLATYLLGAISFGLVSMTQLAPAVSSPSPDDTASALADLVHRWLASDTHGSSEAGKQAVRDLFDETRQWLESEGS